MGLRIEREPDPLPEESAESHAATALVCAWCKTTMRPGTRPASHGVCRSCLVDRLSAQHVLRAVEQDERKAA